MQKAVEIKSSGLILRGMIHTPDNTNKKMPVVIFFHGFTGHKAGAHFIFTKTARMLEKLGIICVRFDFGASGESDGNFEDMSIQKELREANDILDYVLSLKNVDKKRVGLIGHSLGGAIASLLAGKRNKDINSLCLWAPLGNIREVLKHHIINTSYSGFSVKTHIDVGGLYLSFGAVKNSLKVKVFSVLSNYKGNAIIIQGKKDDVIPYELSEDFIDTLGDKIVRYTIEHADHSFNSKPWENRVLQLTKIFFMKEFNI